MGAATTIATFEPGVYITITDVFTNLRKLARVSESGVSYADLDDEGSTPFPIYQELEPVEAGNILGWGLHIVDSVPEQTEAWRNLVEQLINSGEDVLTYNRAAYWAFHNKTYDFAQAMAAGQKETKAIRAGRNRMDAIISSAGAVQ